MQTTHQPASGGRHLTPARSLHGTGRVEHEALFTLADHLAEASAAAPSRIERRRLELAADDAWHLAAHAHANGLALTIQLTMEQQNALVQLERVVASGHERVASTIARLAQLRAALDAPRPAAGETRREAALPASVASR